MIISNIDHKKILSPNLIEIRKLIKKKSVIKKVTPLIKLPEVVEIDKIWLLKRNKSIGKDWYRSKTIFLK